MRLIDFDMVTLSSLNRHAVATFEDVGTPKCVALKKYILKFNPYCNIEAWKEMCDAESVANQVSGNPDYVLDCIDDITTKAALIAYCKANNIRVLSAMGAGAKADPTRLRIGDLTDCLVDKLASKLRWKLEKMGVFAKASKKEGECASLPSTSLPLSHDDYCLY
jgi:tRNA A37 threonylcarbamoyladenosine dehydratase